jgi:hypothetical protein
MNPMYLPRRPARTSEREEAHGHPPAKIYHEGFDKQITRTTDRIHIRQWHRASAQWKSRFQIPREDASRWGAGLSRVGDDVVRRVATIPLKFGGRLDIGAGCGRLLLRITTTDGQCIAHTRLEGPELRALEWALREFDKPLNFDGSV